MSVSSVDHPKGDVYGRLDRIKFTSGFFLFSFGWMCGLTIISMALMPLMLKDLAPGNHDAVFGIANSFSAIFSLLGNLIVGNLSDRTKTIFGKRSPWIFGGSFVTGLAAFGIYYSPNAVVLTILWCLTMVGLNMMIAPIVATLSDRIPLSQRATMSACIAAGTLIGQSVGNLIGARMLGHVFVGFILAGVISCLSGLVTLTIWPREKSTKEVTTLVPEKGSLKKLLESFRPPRNAPDFYRAFFGRTLMILSYYMIVNYQLYLLQDYVGLSVKEVTATMSLMALLNLCFAGLASAISGPVSDRLGRRKFPVVLATAVVVIAYSVPLFVPTAIGMCVFSAVAGFGYGVYSSIDQALNVDVLPSQETAGKDLGILNIATTLGQMIGPLVTSVIVTVLMGYKMVFPIAILFALLSCYFIMRIKSVK